MPSKEEMLQGLTFADARTHIADHFPIYATQLHLARFMMRYELFKSVLNLHGSVIECGVKHGAGVFQWARMSQLMEPYNWTRAVYGFDTFSGFPSIHANDGDHRVGEQSTLDGEDAHLAAWAQAAYMECPVVCHSEREMLEPTEWRPVCNAPRIQLIKGNFMSTGLEFMDRLPSLVVALLYLDFDLYEPTKLALELFLPRMPKGAIVAFDELNHPLWPGETIAAYEYFRSFQRLELRRFPFCPTVSYAVL